MSTSTVRQMLVTGASSGIGAAVAARLAREGAALTLLGRDAKKLRGVAESLDTCADVRTFVVDLARADSIPEAVRRIAAELPRLDALVHAAGTFTRGTALEDSQPLLEEMMQIHVYAPIAMTRELLPMLERSGRGTIVFINSTGVQRPQLIGAQYIACKHALHSLADSLRDEINSRGVRVTTIFPGRTATPMQRSIHQMEGRPYEPERLLQPSDIAELVACAINLPQRAELTDLFVRPTQTLPSLATRPGEGTR
jgi:NADP-dependent 3-hydroxy acid dehydrogenase YdfG